LSENLIAFLKTIMGFLDRNLNGFISPTTVVGQSGINMM
jgi:hypothetical protein